jgi:hypothetical protein
MKAKLAPVFNEPQTIVLTDVIQSSQRDLVPVSDCSELKAIVRDLAAQQKRTSEELAESRKRTDQDLAESRRRTDQDLAESRRRTDQDLAESRRRTDEILRGLAESQLRTDQVVQRLERGLEKLSRQVGGLSDRLGGDLEDVAYIVVHDVLGRELGWQVQPLARTWLQWNGAGQEIDLFGQAQDPTRPDTTIWIVGDVKFNLTRKEVDRFVHKVAKARQHLEGEVFPVCFCYRARPEVQQAVQAAGIRLVFSYGRMI